MGYTHYYKFKENVDSLSKRCLYDIKKVLIKYESILDIKEFNQDFIDLNGIKPNDYEQFSVAIDLNRKSDGFCKTGEKPYDIPVCKILLLLKYHYGDKFYLSSDGLEFDKINEEFGMHDNWKKAEKELRNEFGYYFGYVIKISERGYKYLTYARI